MSVKYDLEITETIAKGVVALREAIRWKLGDVRFWIKDQEVTVQETKN